MPWLIKGDRAVPRYPPTHRQRIQHLIRRPTARKLIGLIVSLLAEDVRLDNDNAVAVKADGANLFQYP